MLELADGGGGALRVERYALTHLPKEAVVDGNIAKPEVVVEALKNTWRALDTRTRDVALALPASAVTAKKIVLPQDTGEMDIETQAIAEANQIVSFPIEDVSLDFQILGPSPRNPQENEILVVVSRRDRIEERVAAAEAAGLKANIMDVDTYATLRAYDQVIFQLPEEGHNQTVAIIDIGATTTHVNILHDNQPVYQRDHPFGGQILTQEIVRRFDLPTEEAEDAKRKGLLPESYESEVLRPFLDAVAVEIQRALQFFFSSTPYQSVNHILLAGGCASIPSLDEMVFSKMQTSTMLANPFSKMAVSSKVKARQLAADAPSLFVACGLALRRFDKE
jgi:type IV pilus assembly protein PilM